MHRQLEVLIGHITFTSHIGSRDTSALFAKSREYLLWSPNVKGRFTAPQTKVTQKYRRPPQ